MITGKIPTRVLGKTGVRVPILGFGTASCGIRRSVKNGVELYHKAIDAGVTYLDTAPAHTGYGRAQEQLGHVLKERRKEAFVVTKCHESNGDDALRLLDKNLTELQTSYADLVYVHSLGDLDPEVVVAKNGILPALLRAKKEKRVRFVGLSGHSRTDNFLRVLKSEYADQIDVMMLAVNFADRYTYNFEERVLPVAAKQRIGLVAMKIFGGANWRSKEMSNSMLPDAQHYQQAFRYALSLPSIATAVVGMATEDELKNNITWAAAFQPLTAAERAKLEEPGQRIARDWGPHFGPTR